MSSRFPISALLKSFLLIMCIDAPESTTNSLSSGLRVDGAGRHQFSEGEKNAILCFSFYFFWYFGQLPRCFTGTSLLPLCLFLRPILKFWSVGATLMKITWANHSKRWILVSNVSMAYDGFSESNTSDWLPYVWALPQNRWRLQRLHILKYANQLSCTFQHSHCTFVTILFRPFAGLFINLAMSIRALFPKTFIPFRTCRTSILEDAIFHRMEWCKFLWGNPCTAVEPFSHWDFCLWDFWFSMHFSHSAA